MHFVAQSLKPQPARRLGHGIKLAPQHVGADHDRDGQALHALRKLKQRVAMFSNGFLAEVDSENRLRLAAREAFYFQRMSPRNPRQRTPARRAEQRDRRTGRERFHVVFPDVVQHQQSPALGKPRLGGGDLLLGRPGLKPELELRRELGRDLGDGTLAAKLKHYRVERALRLPGKLERERGLPAARLAVEQRAACFSTSAA